MFAFTHSAINVRMPYSALQNSDTPREIIKQILGHSDASTTGRYTKGASVKNLNDAIQKLNFSEIDWSKIVFKNR